MVTCKLLGRTGNQMLIIAATIGYAKKHGLEYHIPAHTQDDSKWKPMFTHLENPNYDSSLTKIKIEERGFSFNHLPAPPYKNCNIELNGYFQSHKYFLHCIDDIKSAFKIPYEKTERGCVAIHIRLGDYNNLPDYHPVITKEYLQQAINYFASRGINNFQLFSDDPNEAWDMVPEKLFNISYQPFYRGYLAEELQDLSRGASCDHTIGSNSSFSLWMYYLNQNPDKIGIFPSRWFGPKLPHDTKDLYPDNCIII